MLQFALLTEGKRQPMIENEKDDKVSS